MRIFIVNQPFWGTPIYGNLHIDITMETYYGNLHIDITANPMVSNISDPISYFIIDWNVSMCPSIL